MTYFIDDIMITDLVSRKEIPRHLKKDPYIP